jgi:anion-transporting  ArsA/GET3 family ATPase
MQIIALINQKGGVGKTTCTINIGAGLNKLRKHVLLGIPTARGGKWHGRTVKYMLENPLYKGTTH